ncbi:2-deoxy-5-keto-D-gluconate 6-phosphate aldolase domain-containing protein [Candidimonas nitroreducens]|uniref:IolC myo-catabolism protein n=1 Tax=Candidimonas nitroreducens TaxID=683354 RepID=A0A225MKL3_9BURK|nr:DUF2090 domain-containing protein [Candidimonas nitroreducens]OWT60071.1 IolC myo-catabolism protein [Candidimonas nitroreducens]
MNPGYDKPLYLLPFDHRHSYVSGMFGFQPPLSARQHTEVADSKRLIYDGFREALSEGVSIDRAGILVDEEFGAPVLADARASGCVTAVSVEKSGSDEFFFEYGNAFMEHIAAIAPTFAKVLVRYNPEDDEQLNRRQADRLRSLSVACRDAGQRLMFELLVPANAAQLQRCGGDRDAYDRELRPALMCRAIRALQDEDVEPDVWKIEGLDSRADCEELVGTARRGGRRGVGCIVLGRGADEQRVMAWLRTAAAVPGFIGFAVGRTTFWDAVADERKGRATRAEAAGRIAQRYIEWVRIFEQAAAAAPQVAANGS